MKKPRSTPAPPQKGSDVRAIVRSRVNAEYSNLFELYKHLHAHPELSFHEEKTAVRVADELKRAGYEVTSGVGRHGAVAVLKNGAGPTVMVRADMDALPVKEQTGLPYASTVVTKDDIGNEVPVMHACGHDFHMTSLIGVARVLAQLKDRWHGTLVLIGQPAEEIGGGARAMLKDGLFTRFPKPDFCLALHDKSDLPAGMLAYTPGLMLANVDTVDITVRGLGGHGAWPHMTKDPVVLASQIVLALQTIVSREIEPGQAAVVTVGSIHGGTKHNIIPDEVKLQLTVRTYTDEVRRATLDAINRIARGQALAAGMPEDRLPIVTISDQTFNALFNEPQLTERVARTFKSWFGEENVVRERPTMGGEDFAEYGRTADKIPICLFWVGGVKRKAFDEARRAGKTLPSLHSPFWAPDPEPASQIVLALQTIVSREIQPGQPAVVTVGSIHGGTKHNIIPDEVKLQITVRSYTDEVRKQTLAAIKRIARGEGIAAGLPDDRLPIVKIEDDYTAAMYNDPALTERLVGVFKSWFGEGKVLYRTPSMGGEDFGEYGRTEHKIPICMFDIGAVEPAAVAESKRTSKSLPSLHSPLFAPVPESTLKTGVTAMTAAVLELMGRK